MGIEEPVMPIRKNNKKPFKRHAVESSVIWKTSTFSKIPKFYKPNYRTFKRLKIYMLGVSCFHETFLKRTLQIRMFRVFCRTIVKSRKTFFEHHWIRIGKMHDISLYRGQWAMWKRLSVKKRGKIWRRWTERRYVRQ